MSKNQNVKMMTRILFPSLMIIITAISIWLMIATEGVLSLLLSVLSSVLLFLSVEAITYSITLRVSSEGTSDTVILLSFLACISVNLWVGVYNTREEAAREEADLAAKEQTYKEIDKSWNVEGEKNEMVTKKGKTTSIIINDVGSPTGPSVVVERK